jgi:hypothetical protein
MLCERKGTKSNFNFNIKNASPMIAQQPTKAQIEEKLRPSAHGKK